MTQQMKFAEAGMAIVLPGAWSTLPLDDPEGLERQIASVVKRRVGRDDRLARVRRDAKEQLRSMATAAAAAGAFRVALALEILPGVPFPAAMVFDYATWPPLAAGAVADDESGDDRLRRAFPQHEILPLASGLTARQAITTKLKAGTETAGDVKIQYWIIAPDTERLLHVTVDAPTAGDAELYTELFDAIIDSIRWTGAEVAAP